MALQLSMDDSFPCASAHELLHLSHFFLFPAFHLTAEFDHTIYKAI